MGLRYKCYECGEQTGAYVAVDEVSRARSRGERPARRLFRNLCCACAGRGILTEGRCRSTRCRCSKTLVDEAEARWAAAEERAAAKRSDGG